VGVMHGAGTMHGCGEYARLVYAAREICGAVGYMRGYTVIVTAGGTAEKIDAVRKIANSATGRLGSLITDEFARQGRGRVARVYYVCGEGAALPRAERARMKAGATPLPEPEPEPEDSYGAVDAQAAGAMATGVLESDTLVPNALAPDALESDALAPDALAPDALAPDALAHDAVEIEVVRAEGVAGVEAALRQLLTAERIDAVVHSMAVSDYRVKRLTTAESLAGYLADRLAGWRRTDVAARCGSRTDYADSRALSAFLLQCILENDRLIDASHKVASNFENLIICMQQAPKLIGTIKKLQPGTLLVGFKLLNGVPEQALLDAGYELLQKNACDLVLANDSAQVGGRRHVGYLISPDRSHVRLGTKAEIAREIAGRVLALLGRERPLRTRPVDSERTEMHREEG